MNKYYLQVFAWFAKKLLLNKVLKDHKTSLISFLGILTGSIEALSDGVMYNFLCEYINFFCHLTKTQFYGGFITIVSIVAQTANADRSLAAIERAKAKAEAIKEENLLN